MIYFFEKGKKYDLFIDGEPMTGTVKDISDRSNNIPEILFNNDWFSYPQYSFSENDGKLIIDHIKDVVSDQFASKAIDEIHSVINMNIGTPVSMMISGCRVDGVIWYVISRSSFYIAHNSYPHQGAKPNSAEIPFGYKYGYRISTSINQFYMPTVDMIQTEGLFDDRHRIIINAIKHKLI